jgi:hypothetical protein
MMEKATQAVIDSSSPDERYPGDLDDFRSIFSRNLNSFRTGAADLVPGTKLDGTVEDYIRADQLQATLYSCKSII